ncbi:hypothetical protein K2P47_01335 [Patescibacteria group bacterium]|nr:hypothetical protein [Patescibacteria group bacterium]
MHAITYVICCFFYKQLKGISKQKENGFFWSFLYAIVLFVFIRLDPTLGVFLGYGRPNAYTTRQYMAGDYWQATIIDISQLEALIVCSVLGMLFYFTSQLGSHMSRGSFSFAFTFVLGLVINSIVAYFLLSAFM